MSKTGVGGGGVEEGKKPAGLMMSPANDKTRKVVAAVGDIHTVTGQT